MDKFKLLNEIFKKCYYMSTHSNCHFFFSYSPHVESYDVYYYLGGWTGQNDAVWLNNCTDITPTNLKSTLEKLDGLWSLITNLNNEAQEED